MSASKVDPNPWPKPISLTTITYPLPGNEWPPLGFDQIAQKANKNMRNQKHEWPRWRDSELLTLWAWGRTSKAWLQVLLSLCLPWSLRFPTLEHCATGGEALLPEEQEEWRRKTGLLLHEVYGQSETVGRWSFLGQSGCAELLSPAEELNNECAEAPFCSQHCLRQMGGFRFLG